MDREGQWGYWQLIVVEVTFFNGVDTDMLLPMLQLKKNPKHSHISNQLNPVGHKKGMKEKDYLEEERVTRKGKETTEDTVG